MIRAILTIGYGARDIDAFVKVIKQHGISYLIDVRSRPYSRYKPEFSKDALDSVLKSHAIRYVFLGDKLGGQPADPDCYDGDGKVDYDKFHQKEFYLAGIERLRTAWQQQLTVVIMCSEGKPESCHRSKLIGRTLTEQGIEVTHIDEKDELISQEEVMVRITGGQPSLFGPDFHKLTSRKRYAGQISETPGGTESEDEADRGVSPTAGLSSG